MFVFPLTLSLLISRKSWKLPSSRKFRALWYPQHNMITNKGCPEISILMVVCHDWILKSWLAILNPQSSTLNFEISIVYSPSSHLKYPLSNLNFPHPTLLPPSSVKSMGYLTKNVLKITGFPTKCPQAPLAPLALLALLALLAAFSRSA